MEKTKDNSFWNKLKQFFNNLFSVGNKENNALPESTEKNVGNLEIKKDFISDLKISTQQKDEYIIMLQRDFEDGKIKEEEISEGNKVKLEKLYKEQIEVLNETLESYKSKILKLKNAK